MHWALKLVVYAGLGKLVCSEARLSRHEATEASKLSFDEHESERERRRRMSRKSLEERGVRLPDNMDEIRRNIDITQDLHPRETRRLVERYNEHVKDERARRQMEEDLVFWDRFLQDNSLPPVAPPTESPVLPLVPPTPSPVAPPTLAPVAPVAPPTLAPVAPIAPPTLAPVAPIAPPTLAPVAPIAPPTLAPVAPIAPPTLAPVAPVAPPTLTPVAPVAPPTLAPVAPVAPPTLAPVPSVSRVRQIILPVALFGGVEFQDSNSYQSKSLAWLESSNDSLYSDAKIIQRYALGCVYYATNNVATVFTDEVLGAGVIFPWNNARDWLTDLDECTWSNVLCEQNNGLITRMDMFGNFLTGEFPPEITFLRSSLVNLDLSDNLVFTRGEVFNSWLGTLTNLRILRYEDTNFINSNGIPTEIGNLKQLGFYECSNVRYVGAISSQAFPSDMTQLTYIEMEFNSFNSPIPTQVGLLPNLQFFYARGSSITGNLEFMRNMRAIREIWTDSNEGLTGALPDFFGAISSLASFSVTSSGWSGPLPASIGQLTESMQQLYFYTNRFSGTVPTEYGALTALRRLEMYGNNLVGSIPDSICRLKITRGLNLQADCSICNLSIQGCCTSCV